MRDILSQHVSSDHILQKKKKKKKNESLISSPFSSEQASSFLTGKNEEKSDVSEVLVFYAREPAVSSMFNFKVENGAESKGHNGFTEYEQEQNKKKRLFFFSSN